MPLSFLRQKITVASGLGLCYTASNSYKEVTSMPIRPATINDRETVHSIAQETISAIYPRYYPRGAVDFFLQHHNPAAIERDIRNSCVFLAVNEEEKAVGTVTIRKNEILRLFVLPECQGMGYGKMLLNFAEETVARQYEIILVDASLPAKSLYLKRGYRETEYHKIKTENGDYLCYDVMEKPTQL